MSIKHLRKQMIQAANDRNWQRYYELRAEYMRAQEPYFEERKPLSPEEQNDLRDRELEEKLDGIRDGGQE